jgi:dethiobiotin synthetase
MALGLFVAGTDTGIGKTVAACALLAALRRRGLRARGMKPVASGCQWRDGGLRNDDALALMAGDPAPVDYRFVNPFAFGDPIAPHLAAADEGRLIDLDVVGAAWERVSAGVDVVVVEGVGGWLVPIDDRRTMADMVQRFGWTVLLVVGMRLGCLNHALLSAAAIGARARLGGWVANCCDPDPARLDDNIDALRQRLDAPLIGTLPYRHGATGAELGTHLDSGRLAEATGVPG